MKKVLILGTGGTISCIPSDDGLVPGLDAKALVGKVAGLDELANVECVQLMDLDSSNIGPRDWQVIARAVADNYSKYDGFVITHGTDTMAYTAAALGQMLHNCQKPVIITGAQLSMEEAGTDAKHNLYYSVMVAASEAKGVALVFGNKVIHGLKAKKMCTENFNGFWSINEEVLAQIIAGEIVWRSKVGAAYGTDKFFATTDLETKVAIVKITPGLTGEILEYYLEKGYLGVVLEGYGAGGVPNGEINWLPYVEKLLKAGIRVVCASQCPYDGVHLDRYPIGILANRLGAESGDDMTTEVLLVKLMLELAGKSKIDFLGNQ